MTDFDVLCTLCVFTVDVPLMEKTGCWFAVTKVVNNTVESVTFSSKDAGHWPENITPAQLFFTHFASANQLTGWYLHKWNIGHKWVKDASSTNIDH